MSDHAVDDAAILFSILNRMDGFMYRCCNDASYTMLFMQGDVEKLTGHPGQMFTGPEQQSYSAMTHPDDLAAVYAGVDAALAERRNWHLDYRLLRPDGSDLWVHEIGGGVWLGQDLQYLEGVVVDADRGRRVELQGATLLQNLTRTSRDLVGHAGPITKVLQAMRILALNARLEAGRAGAHGAAFGFVAQEMSVLANESSALAQAIAEVTAELEGLLQQEVA